MFETLSGLMFYMLAGILVLSSTMVVAARNPVHSVLFLILAFFNAAGLFLLMGAEFIAMILVIVYVGAVAVLFLFVVMMLDVNFEELRKGIRKQLPLGLTIGLILLVEVILVVMGWQVLPSAGSFVAAPAESTAWLAQTNTHALGRLIYTQYIYLFQIAGLILLVAMIGAIVLTLRHRPGVRRQNPGLQAQRRKEDVLAIRQVKIGEGQ